MRLIRLGRNLLGGKKTNSNFGAILTSLLMSFFYTSKIGTSCKNDVKPK